MKKTYFLLSILLLASTSLALADTPVEFYATISNSTDTNMLTMTTDLFYKQLQGLNGYTVIDKRDTAYTDGTNTGSSIAFFAEIQEAGGSSWLCTLNAIRGGTPVQASKTYDSYYKILIEAKASLESILSKVSAVTTATSDTASRAPTLADLDALAGTWTGEEQIDKIIILRGGKGFVFFKNGASMNVTVTVAGSSVTIMQNGRANASYFPELSREVALKSAATASPISWKLTIVDASTMRGTKTTLIADSNSSSGTAMGDFSVEWVKH